MPDPETMDAYVMPIGGDRYELYCETPAPVEPVGESGKSIGWFTRLKERFAYMVHEAESRDGGETAPPVEGGWWERAQRRLLAWVAERIAEQRLLWNLRRQTMACLVYPADMTFEQARTLVMRMLRRDQDRHRIWLGVNAVLLILSAVLALVPGPNLVAYYFAFRVVGHWLSMRGAAQGLSRITWTGRPSQRLVDLRRALPLESVARAAAVQAIGAELALPSLARFIERVATR